MEKLANSIDKVVVDMTVRCMLNPDNQDFYLHNITVEKLESLLGADDYASQIFWSAFAIASAQIKPKLSFEEWLDCYCPECGCNTYLTGCRCPNCDHYED